MALPFSLIGKKLFLIKIGTLLSKTAYLNDFMDEVFKLKKQNAPFKS